MQCPNCRVPAFAHELSCAACGTKMHPDALAEGTIIAGRHQLQGLLGAGGFAITYLAVDTLLNRRVALKELFWNQCRRSGESVVPAGTDAVTSFEDLKARTLREAQALGAFNSDRVVRVFDCFQANGTVYVSMEYLEGTTLRDELRSHPEFRLPPARFIEIFRALLQALSIVHDQGLLHRDIKPDNVMLVARRGPVLIDFGAVRPDNPTHTLSGVSFASGGYTPLEQTAGQRNVGRHSDIYALGATMYEALTGQAPTYAGDRLDVNNADRLARPNTVDPTIPSALSDFVMRCLTVDWRQRPGSAEEVSNEFERALAQPSPQPPRRAVQPDPALETIRYQPGSFALPEAAAEPSPVQGSAAQPGGGSAPQNPPPTRETTPLGVGVSTPVGAPPGSAVNSGPATNQPFGLPEPSASAAKSSIGSGRGSAKRTRLVTAGAGVVALAALGIFVATRGGSNTTAGPDSSTVSVIADPSPTTTQPTTEPTISRPTTVEATTTPPSTAAPTTVPEVAPSTTTGPTTAPIVTPPSTVAALRVVRIGVIANQGGAIDRDGLRAVQVAAAEAQTRLGPVWKIDVLAIDDRGDAAMAKKAAETFVSDPSVIAIIGPTSSDTVEAALPVLSGTGIPMFTPTATRVSLTRDDAGQRRANELFRLIPNDGVQGRAAARLAREAGAAKIAVLQDASSLGGVLRTGVAAELGAGYTAIDATGTADALAARLIADGYSDVIFAGTDEKLFAAVARVVSTKQPAVRYWSGDALLGAIWGSQAGVAGPHLSVLLSGVPNTRQPRAADYNSATAGTKGISPDGFGAYTYDVARFVIDTVSNPATPLADARTARNSVLARAATDDAGALSGSLRFDSFGEPTSARLSVFTWTRSKSWAWQRVLEF